MKQMAHTVKTFYFVLKQEGISLHAHIHTPCSHTVRLHHPLQHNTLFLSPLLPRFNMQKEKTQLPNCQYMVLLYTANE